MQRVDDSHYYVYITSNAGKSMLDVGVTGDLLLRMHQLQQKKYTHSKEHLKPDCIYLVYYEAFKIAQDAMLREEELKSLSIKKKQMLISEFNPDWRFLNIEVARDRF